MSALIALDFTLPAPNPKSGWATCVNRSKDNYLEQINGER